MRLILGDQDLVLGVGEAAEFDTQLPHWFGSTGEGPAEVLSIFGRPGERMHVRARPRAPERHPCRGRSRTAIGPWWPGGQVAQARVRRGGR